MPRRHAAQCASALTCEMNPGAVSAGKVLFAAAGKKNEVVGEEDSLTVVVRKQEAALKKLEQKHGAGYGKPPPGSKSEARAKRSSQSHRKQAEEIFNLMSIARYNESCMREILQLCGLISEKGE